MYTYINKSNLLEALARHIGAEKGAHVNELVREITRTDSTPDGERTVRKLVTILRDEGHHICAQPNQGYYMAGTPEELDATCEFLYTRAMCSLRQIAAMKRISLPDLRGQLHLPT